MPSDLAVAFPFEFLSRQPVGPLERFVESIWYARGTVPYEREKIAPTGSTVAVFVLGDPILETADDGAGPTLRADRGFLIGPHECPVVNEPTGETYAVGIVGTPVGCEAIFGCGPSRLRGQVVDLEAAWEPAARIRSRLLTINSPEAMLDFVEGHLVASIDSGVVGLDRCEAAVVLLEANPRRAISEVAAELGVSHGHLDYEFTRVVGLSPRALSRLLRMRRLLAELNVYSDIDWPDQAATFGWFDQAHLIRDFRRHTGVTPMQYVRAQRTFLGPDQAGAGFVPEI